MSSWFDNGDIGPNDVPNGDTPHVAMAKGEGTSLEVCWDFTGEGFEDGWTTETISLVCKLWVSWLGHFGFSWFVISNCFISTTNCKYRQVCLQPPVRMVRWCWIWLTVTNGVASSRWAKVGVSGAHLDPWNWGNTYLAPRSYPPRKPTWQYRKTSNHEWRCTCIDCISYFFF